MGIMDIIDSILNNKKYDALIEQLSDEILISILKDDNIALEMAAKCITKVEPYKINDVEYLQKAADATQKLAQKVLAVRSKN